MSNLSAERMQNIYTSLTSSISGSVKNIRQKQAENFTGNKATLTSNDNSLWGGFSLNNYAVSYLQPQTLLNIHNLREDKIDGRLKDRSANRQDIDEGQGQASATKTDTQEVSVVSFLENLQNIRSKPDAAVVAGIYSQNNKQTSGFSVENFSGTGFSMGEVKYANETYNFNYNLNNREPDIKIEFMHKNNRSFDYRV